MRISVVMATYNGRAHVEEQLASILAQTRLPDEIVVVDDASHDGTPDLVEAALAKGAVPYRLLRHAANQGATRTFCDGIRAAANDWIALSDWDDVWYPERLAVLAEHAEQPGAGLVFSDMRVTDERLESLGYSFFTSLAFSVRERADVAEGRAFQVLARRNVVSGASCLFRRSAVEPFLDIPSLWLHDYWIALAASLQGKVVCIERELVHYRQHRANATGGKKPTFAGDTVRARAKTRAAYTDEADLFRAMRVELERNAERLPPKVFAMARATLDGKIAHLDARASMQGGGRLRRAVVELMAGRYHRYGRGLRGFVKDLLI